MTWMTLENMLLEKLDTGEAQSALVSDLSMGRKKG